MKAFNKDADNNVIHDGNKDSVPVGTKLNAKRIRPIIFAFFAGAYLMAIPACLNDAHLQKHRILLVAVLAMSAFFSAVGSLSEQRKI